MWLPIGRKRIDAGNGKSRKSRKSLRTMVGRMVTKIRCL